MTLSVTLFIYMAIACLPRYTHFLILIVRKTFFIYSSGYSLYFTLLLLSLYFILSELALASYILYVLIYAG